jgi:hypothetical protein
VSEPRWDLAAAAGNLAETAGDLVAEARELYRRRGELARRARWAVPGAVVVIGALATALSTLDAQGWFRTIVVVAFLVAGPGLVLVPRLRLDDRVMQLVLVIVLSLCIDALVASVALYLGFWLPTLILGVLVIVTTAIAIWDIGIATGPQGDNGQDLI